MVRCCVSCLAGHRRSDAVEILIFGMLALSAFAMLGAAIWWPKDTTRAIYWLVMACCLLLLVIVMNLTMIRLAMKSHFP